jgi:glycosyltransferase involved in cell wall biosynthesis
VLQLLSAAGPHDAVTTQALAWRRMMGSWGVSGEVFADTLNPGLDGSVRPIARLRRSLSSDDLLVIHYTAYAQALDAALHLPQRKLLVYHNVTPPELLWDWEPIVAARCALGRAQLREWVGRVDATATATGFNAADLREAGFEDVQALPALYFFDPERLAPSAGGDETPVASTVIFVGRLSPNKRQDELIKAFALYQRHRQPDSRLLLVGGPIGPAYTEHLERVTDATGARDVVIGGRPQPELNDLYRTASVFVCLSTHEGFCLPLLEALHFDVPVIARRAGAVPEVLGEAGILIDEDDLPTIAELIDICARDEDLREELRRRGRERLRAYDSADTERQWRGLLEPLLTR